MIRARNLSKTFFQGSKAIKVLDALSFELKQGETLSITGSSGSGKTTLLSILAGLDHLDSGRLAILDEEVTQFSTQEWTQFRASHMGIVFQQFFLMPHLSALENVQLAADITGNKNSREQAKDILSEVGLSKRFDHFPSELSGGESQRVAIARALATQPKILLADEPSGNLDQETGKHVMDLIFNVANNKNLSLVLVTHDLALAQRCSQTLHLNHGKLEKVSREPETLSLPSL